MNISIIERKIHSYNVHDRINDYMIKSVNIVVYISHVFTNWRYCTLVFITKTYFLKNAFLSELLLVIEWESRYYLTEEYDRSMRSLQ